MGDALKREAEIKRKGAEAEAKRQAEEEKKNSAESIARKKAAEDAAKAVRAGKLDVKGKSVRESVAGGFFQGQHVTAVQDITIRGVLIVRNGTAGTIMGRAESDPQNRIAVKFVPRADGGSANINCVPKEIRKG